MAIVTGVEARKKARNDFQLVFNYQAATREYDVFNGATLIESIYSYNSAVVTEGVTDKVITTVDSLNSDTTYYIRVAAIINGQRDIMSATLTVDMSHESEDVIENEAVYIDDDSIDALATAIGTAMTSVTIPVKITDLTVTVNVVAEVMDTVHVMNVASVTINPATEEALVSIRYALVSATLSVNSNIVSSAVTLNTAVTSIPTITIGSMPSITGIVTATIVSLPSVTINIASSEVTLNTAVTSLPTVTVIGNVASGVADAGNPVKVGGIYNSATITLATGQRGDMQLSINGQLYTSPGKIAGEDFINDVMRVGIVSITPTITVTGSVSPVFANTTVKSGALSTWGLTTVLTPTSTKKVRLGYIYLQNPSSTAVDVYVKMAIAPASASVTLYPSTLTQYQQFSHSLVAGDKYIEGDVNGIVAINCTPTATLNYHIEYDEA